MSVTLCNKITYRNPSAFVGIFNILHTAFLIHFWRFHVVAKNAY